MAEYLIQDTSLTSIASQIRTLIGTSSAMTPANMSSNIQQANNEVGTQENLISQIKSILYNAVASNATVGTATVTTSISSDSISFTVPSAPSLYFMIPTNSSTFNLSSTAYVINILYDGTTIHDFYMPSTGNWTYSATDITASYSGTTLTLTSAAAKFVGNSYQLVYVIVPSAYAKGTIETSSAILSANDKSISFTGLSGEPSAFAIIPTTTAAVNSSASYVHNITFQNNAYRLTYTSYSSSRYRINSTSSGVSKSYSNGTLTVTCTTPNFRSSVAYKLVAVIPG